MPWKDTTAMEQKVEFICEWITGKYTITELSQAFEISRPTAYRLINNYENYGIESLMEKSKAPRNHPNKTKKEVVDRVVELKGEHMHWGAKKLHKLLYSDFTADEIPTILTVHNILLRNGLVCPQKRLRRVKPTYPIFDPQECNQVWSADYKGKFLMGNKKYCHPLTIADSFSRIVFTAKAHYGEKFRPVKEEFTRVFRKYGMPKQIHTDNGSPFGAIAAIQRFTRLSYWFIDLGILPVYSDPAHPEQNGRHERMHRDLKASCASPSCFDLKSQQRKLNSFVKEYNQVRPHEALGMETPAKVHKYSSRPFQEHIRAWEYPSNMNVLKVTKNGSVRWGAYWWVFISSSLADKHIGIEELGNGIWKVVYRDVFLGYFNEKDIRDKEKSIRLSTNLV